jgi:nicotinate phosphoribosyltransferase
MVEYDGNPVMKLSSAKVTAPGAKQVFRCPGYADVIGLRDEGAPGRGHRLLETVMRDGRRTGERPTLEEQQARFTADLEELPHAALRVRAPIAPRAVPSERLSALISQVRGRLIGP